MSADLLTCERVDEEDLDTRYLTGRLSEAEASAFEQHYFGCERCWALLQEGLALRGAMAGRPAAARPRANRLWWGLAAAGIVVAGFGVWRISGPEALSDPDAMRGTAPLAVYADATGDAATAMWTPIEGADVYHVRLFAADGTLLHERQVGDTMISVPLDSIARPLPEGAFWDVEALNRLRDPVGRSEITKAVLPADSS